MIRESFGKKKKHIFNVKIACGIIGIFIVYGVLFSWYVYSAKNASIKNPITGQITIVIDGENIPVNRQLGIASLGSGSEENIRSIAQLDKEGKFYFPESYEGKDYITINLDTDRLNELIGTETNLTNEIEINTSINKVDPEKHFSILFEIQIDKEKQNHIMTVKEKLLWEGSKTSTEAEISKVMNAENNKVNLPGLVTEYQ